MQPILHIEFVRWQMPGMLLADFLFSRTRDFPQILLASAPFSLLPWGDGVSYLNGRGKEPARAYLLSLILSLGCSLPVETIHFDLLLQEQVFTLG